MLFQDACNLRYPIFIMREQVPVGNLDRKTAYEIHDYHGSDPVAKGIRDEILEGHENFEIEIRRLKLILSVIKNDASAMGILRSLLSDCTVYLQAVVGNVFARKLLRHSHDAADRRKEAEESDRVRRLKHNAVLAELGALRRYVWMNYGPEGHIRPHSELPETVLYTGASDGRGAVGLWACRMATALAALSDEEVFALSQG